MSVITKIFVFFIFYLNTILLHAEWRALCCGGGEANQFLGDSPNAVCAVAVASQEAWAAALNSCETFDYEGVVEASRPSENVKICSYRRNGNTPAHGGGCGGEIRFKGYGNLAVSYLESFRLEDDFPPATCNREANPCDVITGKKTEHKEDYSDAYISFGRHYESGRADPVAWIGAYWRHSFDVSLDRQLPALIDQSLYPKARIQLPSDSIYGTKSNACLHGWPSIKNDYMRGLIASGQAIQAGDSCNIELNGDIVHSLAIVRTGQYSESGDYGDAGDGSPIIKIVSRPSGGFYLFKKVNGKWLEQNNYSVELIEVASNSFEFIDANGLIDTFVDHALTKRQLPNGDFLSFTYMGNGRLETITHSKGETYTFSYNENDQIETFTNPNGSIGYRYDANYNLEYVDYEDGNTLQYHYEDQDFVHHITGITDERGVRYATWSYDDDGRVVSSEHAGGAEHVGFDYQAAATVVTDHANGGARTYHLGFEGGKPIVTHITGDKCPDCFQRGAQNRLYDGNGHDDKITDWEGNVTDYDHNDRGLEASRTEGLRWDNDQVNTTTVTTPETRTITTEWHPKFRLETRISEPDMVTDFVYDCDNGRLLEKKVWGPAQAPAYIPPVCS